MTTAKIAYNFPGTIERWVDGDTLWVVVDLGFRMSVRLDFRLYGVDTPERGKPGYREAASFVSTYAPIGKPVILRTYKDPDKYGRWLAEVITLDGENINQMLVARGLAVEYFGGTK